jgi:hypothetical protein
MMVHLFVCRLLLLAAGLGFFAAESTEPVQPENHITELITAATEPFLRDIEILKEKLDINEARRDTLEAATEQFRIQAKSLRRKLEEERTRYENLVSMSTAKEERLQAQLQGLGQKLENSENANNLLQKSLDESRENESASKSSHEKEMQLRREDTKKLQGLGQKLENSENANNLLQKSLDEARENESASESSHEKEMQLRREDIKKLKGRLQNEHINLLQLSLKLEQRNTDVLEAKALYFDLRLQLFSANEKLRKIEATQNANRVREFWVRILEIDEVAAIVERFQSFLLWCRDYALPTLAIHFYQFIGNTKTQAKSIANRIHSRLPTIDGAETVLFRVMSFARGAETVLFRVMSFSRGVSTFVSTRAVSVSALLCYQAIHEAAISRLGSMADLVSRFCMLQEPPSPTSWLYTGVMLFKHHSLSILLWMEAVVAFLCLKFVVKSTIANRKSGKSGKSETSPRGSLLFKAKKSSRHHSKGQPSIKGEEELSASFPVTSY